MVSCGIALTTYRIQYSYALSIGTIAPIEREVRDLASGLQAVKDEQEYIVVRERRHRDTAESTNARVMWWSVFQGIVLVRHHPSPR